MAFKKIFEGIATFEKDDHGMAMIAQFDEQKFLDKDEGMFVRLQSWSEQYNHPEVEEIKGKKLRITVEEIE